MIRTTLLSVSALVLAGCAGNTPPRSIGDAFKSSGDAGGRKACVFYFDYKSDTLRDDNQAQLEEWAARLRDNPTKYIELEGRTDKTGSDQYNFDLGQRRAESVKKSLIARGALKTQIRVVSAGESKLSDPGNSEQAHAANRCVDVYEHIPHRPDAVRGSKQP